MIAEQLELAPESVRPPVTYTRICDVTDSRVIEKVAYAPQEKRLRIWFTTPSVWEFDDVWPSDYAALVSAYSPGEVFNHRIRGRYPARRIKEIVDREIPVTKPAVHGHAGAD